MTASCFATSCVPSGLLSNDVVIIIIIIIIIINITVVWKEHTWVSECKEQLCRSHSIEEVEGRGSLSCSVRCHSVVLPGVHVQVVVVAVQEGFCVWAGAEMLKPCHLDQPTALCLECANT